MNSAGGLQFGLLFQWPQEWLQQFDGAVEKDAYVFARRHNKNVLNNVAATMRSSNL